MEQMHNEDLSSENKEKLLKTQESTGLNTQEFHD